MIRGARYGRVIPDAEVGDAELTGRQLAARAVSVCLPALLPRVRLVLGLDGEADAAKTASIQRQIEANAITGGHDLI